MIAPHDEIGMEWGTIKFVTTQTPLSSLPNDSLTMNPTERRASATLASIFALRMLGLFLVLSLIHI